METYNLAEIARLSATRRCRSFSVLLMEASATGTALALWRVPCKSWSCPRCAKRKTREVAHRARAAFMKDRPRFLTLTIKPRPDLAEAFEHTNRAWNRLRTNITKKFGKVKYFKVLENQPSTGMPHFHVILNRYLPASWLNVAIPKAGFGRIYRIQEVRNELCYGYVVKYLSKGISDDTFLSALIKGHHRRFSFSRGCPLLLKGTGYAPCSIHNTRDMPLLSALLSLQRFDISISSGWYPLSISPNWVCYRSPASVPLLPAPPTSGPVGGSSSKNV